MTDTQIHRSWLDTDEDMPEHINAIRCECGTIYRVLTDHGLCCLECGHIITHDQMSRFIESFEETKH